MWLSLDQYQQADQDCTLALQHKTNNPTVYLNRGLALYRLGQYQKACCEADPAGIADFTIAIQLDHEAYSAYYNRGLA